jgi:CRP-like cAMP-binding protein
MSRNWIPADQFTPAELAVRYEIPREEIESFQAMVRIYPQGAAVIREGNPDRTLFLLRFGVVDVLKQAGPEQREHIARIPAVNFFGEMSLLNDRPRSASVEVHSGEALVYAVDRPNVSLILGNPRWAELLLTRLSKDLARADDQLAAAAQTTHELENEKRRLEESVRCTEVEREVLVENVARVIAALSTFQGVIQDEAIVGSRGWVYLQALNRLTALLAQKYLPELSGRQRPADLQMLHACLEELGRKEPKPIYRNLRAALGPVRDIS